MDLAVRASLRRWKFLYLGDLQVNECSIYLLVLPKSVINVLHAINGEYELHMIMKFCYPCTFMYLRIPKLLCLVCSFHSWKKVILRRSNKGYNDVFSNVVECDVVET